jgi:hypothetical protein
MNKGRYITIKGKKYYYEGTYDTYPDAHRLGILYYSKSGKNYYVRQTAYGYITVRYKYKLYIEG